VNGSRREREREGEGEREREREREAREREREREARERKKEDGGGVAQKQHDAWEVVTIEGTYRKGTGTSAVHGAEVIACTFSW
jgi:hypothetical protein